MRLEPGDTFGRYAIEGLLGEGGMGSVYQAVDTKLARRVALKLLRQGRTEDPEGRARGAERLLREARAAAAFDHANAVGIHDVGEIGDVPYIAMELVVGRPLRAYVGDASVPVATRLRWLADVARALDAAHARGLVHRDVKPENVMIREDGTVKVLDFGIARVLGDVGFPSITTPSAEPVAPAIEAEPWRSTVSREGVLLGTPRYVAPEQLNGAEVDGRADQFGWGVMAYELLAGVPPWAGDTASYTMLLEVLTAEALPLREVAPDVSPEVARVVARAMAKEPAERFASMADIVAALEGPRRAPQAVAGGGRKRAAVAAALILGGGAALALGLAMRRPKPTIAPTPSAPAAAAAREARDFTFKPVHLRRLTFGGGCDEFPSFTPDRRRVVFDTTRGKDRVIAVLSIDGGAQRMLTDLHGKDMAPDVSPDGKRVAFLRTEGGETGAWVVDLDGGAPRSIAKGAVRPTFSPDGSAVWAGDAEHPTRFDLASGQATRRLDSPPGAEPPTGRELPDGRFLAAYPLGGRGAVYGVAEFAKDGAMRWLSHDAVEEGLALSPDGGFAVGARQTEANTTELFAIPTAGGEPLGLGSPGVTVSHGLAFAPGGGSVVWSTCRARAWAVRLDAGGQLARLHDPVAWEEGSTAEIPGTKLRLVCSMRSGEPSTWVVDPDDAVPPRELSAPSEYGIVQASVSPDGKLAALELSGGGLAVSPIDGGAHHMLTEQTTDARPMFRKGSREVVFTRRTDDGPRVFSVGVDGGDARPLLEPGTRHAAPSPSDDRIAYLAGTDDARLVPMIVDMQTGARRKLSPKLGEGRYRVPAFSLDGRRVALLTGESGVVEVDAATGAVLRSGDAGAGGLSQLEYVGADPVMTRTERLGELWTADGAF